MVDMRKNRNEIQEEAARLDAATAALISLTEAGIPMDVQELLIVGDPSRGIAPGSLSKAIETVIRSLSSQPVADGLPQDVINLVIAAREACDSWQLSECEFKKLDHALDAFSERVPYENEPNALPASPGASE